MSDLHAKEPTINDLLFQAADAGDLAQVKTLLEQKADPNHFDPGIGVTPLHIAAEKGHTNVIAELLERGAKVNLYTQSPDPEVDNTTALMLASAHGTVAAVELLLSKQAEIEAASTLQGFTPLSMAIIAGREDTVATLLKHKANVHHKAKVRGHDSPLFTAVRQNREKSAEIVGLLVASGANPKQTDAQGRTPLDIATRDFQYDMVAILNGEDPKLPATSMDSSSIAAKQSKLPATLSSSTPAEDAANRGMFPPPQPTRPTLEKSPTKENSRAARVAFGTVAVGTVTAVICWASGLDKTTVKHATKVEQAFLNIGFAAIVMAIALVAARAYFKRASQKPVEQTATAGDPGSSRSGVKSGILNRS